MTSSKKIPIALQLYSVREDCAKDFPGTLKAVAKMGYAGVEFAGYYNNTADQLKKMLAELGLKVAGTHTGIDTLRGEKLQQTIEFHKVLGNKFLTVPSLPDETFTSRDACLAMAEEFNRIAGVLKAQGMFVGYHNHAKEFTNTIDGQTAWDFFFSHTRDVVMQLDTGNALHGGAKALDILKKFPGRARTVHLKEYSATNDKAVVGAGDIPWEQVLTACETLGGTEWYIVEQETYAYPPMECVDLCLKHLRKLGR